MPPKDQQSKEFTDEERAAMTSQLFLRGFLWGLPTAVFCSWLFVYERVALWPGVAFMVAVAMLMGGLEALWNRRRTRNKEKP